MSKTDQTETVSNRHFQYDFYRRLVRTIDRDFEFRTLASYPSCRSVDRPVAFMRHDVDVCIDEAVEMARIEHDLGIQSTYMILPSTPLYDVDEKRDRIDEIRSLGHEIGLHCAVEFQADPAIRDGRTDGGPTDGDLIDGNLHDRGLTDGGLTEDERDQIRIERERLESVLDEPIRSISYHQPIERVLYGPSHVEGMVNAYSEELMSTYISDSGGRWREGSPIGSVQRAIGSDSIQVLTHPVWWADGPRSPFERFFRVADRLDVIDERVRAELVSIFPPYGMRIASGRT